MLQLQRTRWHRFLTTYHIGPQDALLQDTHIVGPRKHIRYLTSSISL